MERNLFYRSSCSDTLSQTQSGRMPACMWHTERALFRILAWSLRESCFLATSFTAFILFIIQRARLSCVHASRFTFTDAHTQPFNIAFIFAFLSCQTPSGLTAFSLQRTFSARPCRLPFTMKCDHPSCQKEGTKSCAKCKTASYCGRECQVGHWKVHKKSCNKALPRKAGTFPFLRLPREVRDQVRA